MTEKIFIIGGAEFAAIDPLPAGVDSDALEWMYDFTDAQKISFDTLGLVFSKLISAGESISSATLEEVRILTNKNPVRFTREFISGILGTFLTPKSGVSVADAYKMEPEGAGEPLRFFSQSVTGRKESVPAKTASSKNSNAPRKRKA